MTDIFNKWETTANDPLLFTPVGETTYLMVNSQIIRLTNHNATEIV